MFKGIINHQKDYYALTRLDTIIDLCQLFKIKFSTTIDDIKIDIESRNKFTVQVNMDNFILIFNACRVEFSTEKDINTFNEVYNFLLPLLNYDFKAGDICFNDRQKGVVEEIVNERYIKIKFDDGKTREEHGCWTLRF